MTLPTKPIDVSQLEFRYQGASEFKAFNQETEKRDEHQARDDDTGFPIFTIRCQVVHRQERESGMIAVRVPLAEAPSKDMEFEHPVTFANVTAKDWSMDGRSGQTWIAKAMTVLPPSGAPAPPPAAAASAGSGGRKKADATAS